MHLGTKPATQDFMFDWESSTKFEGSFIGHTFVARLASDPTRVVDSYTLEPTRIVDCPTLKQAQQVQVPKNVAEVVLGAEGTTEESVNPSVATMVDAASISSGVEEATV